MNGREWARLKVGDRVEFSSPLGVIKMQGHVVQKGRGRALIAWKDGPEEWLSVRNIGDRERIRHMRKTRRRHRPVNDNPLGEEE